MHDAVLLFTRNGMGDAPSELQVGLTRRDNACSYSVLRKSRP
jgi:hypothetical protein